MINANYSNEFQTHRYTNKSRIIRCLLCRWSKKWLKSHEMV